MEKRLKMLEHGGRHIRKSSWYHTPYSWKMLPTARPAGIPATGVAPGDETWTLDGRYLMFGSSDKSDSIRGYMRVPIEGGEPQPIGISASQDGQVRFPREFGNPFYHPNGRQLVYTARGEMKGGETWVLEKLPPQDFQVIPLAKAVGQVADLPQNPSKILAEKTHLAELYLRPFDVGFRLVLARAASGCRVFARHNVAGRSPFGAELAVPRTRRLLEAQRVRERCEQC